MIAKISGESKTCRRWNGRDDISQHYLGRVPHSEHKVSLTLTWKKEKHSKSHLVGKFELDMPKLLAAGYVREVDDKYLLRFQRSGGIIEIAINRSSPALKLSKLPSNYK